MTLSEAQKNAMNQAFDAWNETQGVDIWLAAFTAGLDYAKQEQADSVSGSRWADHYFKLWQDAQQAEIERVRAELDNERGLRRRLGRLINNWRKEAARDYYRVYNPGGASSLNNAATALESVLVGWKFEEKK